MMQKGPPIDFKHPATLELSVVVPVHQVRLRPGLKRCLESVLPQLKDGMELVVVDHSGDPAIFRSEEYDDRWWINEAPTVSKAGDWNLALSHARGKWIHLLADDDRLLPGFYKVSRSSAGAWYCGWRGENAEGGVVAKLDQAVRPFWPNIAVSNFLTPSAVVVARETYERFGGYEPTTPASCCDWEFYTRISQDDATRWSCAQAIMVVHADERGGKKTSEELEASLWCIERRFWAGGVPVNVCEGACGVLYKTALTQSVDQESEEMWRLACEFNRLTLRMKAAEKGGKL